MSIMPLPLPVLLADGGSARPAGGPLAAGPLTQASTHTGTAVTVVVPVAQAIAERCTASGKGP